MEVVLLVGLPASGKSYYAEQMKNDYDIFSSDAVRKELYGDASVQKNPADVFSLLQERARESLFDGKSVVIDATNIISKDRAPYIEMGKTLGADSIRAVVFATPIDVCKERNAKRERSVPEYVYDKMMAKFEVPSLEEGFTDIEMVEYNKTADLQL